MPCAIKSKNYAFCHYVQLLFRRFTTELLSSESDDRLTCMKINVKWKGVIKANNVKLLQSSGIKSSLKSTLKSLSLSQKAH